MQAIVTKVLPATDTKGRRVKATCEAGSVIVSYHDHRTGCRFDNEEFAPYEVRAHVRAISTLLERLDWSGEWVLGWLPRNHKETIVAVCTQPQSDKRNIVYPV